MGLDLSDSASSAKRDSFSEIAKMYLQHPTHLLTKSVSAVSRKAQDKRLNSDDKSFGHQGTQWMIANRFTDLEYPKRKVRIYDTCVIYMI